MAGQNIDIRIAYVERGRRVGAQLIHHMQRDGGLGLGWKRVDTTLHQRKTIGTKVLFDKRGRRNMVLVGEHGKLNARGAQAVEHLDRAIVGSGVVFLVLAVIGPKLGKRLLKHSTVARVLGGHKALDQLKHAVSHLVAVFVHGKRGPAVRLTGMVAGGRQVLERIEDGTVQIKDHMGKGCCHGCSCRLSCKAHPMILGLRVGRAWNLNICSSLELHCGGCGPLPLADPGQLLSHEHVEDAGGAPAGAHANGGSSAFGDRQYATDDGGVLAVAGGAHGC